MKLTWFRSEMEYKARQRDNEDEIGRRWSRLEWASEYSKEHRKIVRDRKVLECPAAEICPPDGVYPAPGKTPDKPIETPPAGTSGQKQPERKYPRSWGAPPPKPGSPRKR
jgi:hypothetical protein